MISRLALTMMPRRAGRHLQLREQVEASSVRPTLFAVTLAFAACRGNVQHHSGAVDPSVRANVLAIEGTWIELRIPDGPMALSPDQIARWAEDAAHAVKAYYGRFPVERATIEVMRTEGRGIDGGKTFDLDGSAVIRVDLGARAEASDLARDWVLTHEMVHTALPALPQPNHWLEEGLATYVEPIARAQVGLESAAEVWKQLVQGLPQGLPRTGDQGLDRTPTWGRTYWGGALYCLLADIEIRERTKNRSGLQDALRAIVADGRTILTSSPIDRVLAKGDKAVGVPVLSELYAKHATHAESVDLDALWKRLGISMYRGRIRFDDTAPLAEVRRAITKAEK